MLISVGDKVRPGIYKVHSRFERVVNFSRANRLVSVVDETIGPGPVNIVIRDMNEARADVLEIRPPYIKIGPNRYRYASDRIFRSAIPKMKLDGRAFERGLADFEKILVKKAPKRSLAFLMDQKRMRHFRSGFDRAWALRIQQGQQALFNTEQEADEWERKSFLTTKHAKGAKGKARGVYVGVRGNQVRDLAAKKIKKSQEERCLTTKYAKGAKVRTDKSLARGVRMIRGCGLGLTPGGDDFIAGMLMALNLQQILYKRDCRRLIARVLHLAKGQSLLSNTFLEMAGQGLVFEKMQNVIRALFSRDQKVLRRCVDRLLSIGATSGADLATGFVMALKTAKSKSLNH